MFNFLKICGKGILAILLSPLWLSAFLLTAVLGLILFIFNSFRILIIDLHNVSKPNAIDPLGDLPEDLEALRIKKANEAVVQVVDTSQSSVTAVPSSPTPAQPLTTPPTSAIPQDSTFVEVDTPSVDSSMSEQNPNVSIEETSDDQEEEDEEL